MRRRRSGGNEEGRGLQLAEMAYVPEEDGRRRGARRMPPTDRADRAQKGRRDLPVAPDVPPLKRKQGGAQSGKAGRHGVDELDKRHAGKETPWLIWRARLSMPGHTNLLLGKFPTADDAARAYDAEVRRRGWANARPLNFPQPEEQGEYAHAAERCDERGLPLSLPDLPTSSPLSAATRGAVVLRPPRVSTQRRGKSGLFGVSKNIHNKVTPWRAAMTVSHGNDYAVGYFATRDEAARAYDAEVRRRGWALTKRLNFPDPPADVAALPAPPPSSAALPAGAYTRPLLSST